MPPGVFFRIRPTFITNQQQIIMNFLNYLKETQAELKEVKFPSTSQTTVYTVAVIGLSILVAALLGGVDFGLREGLVNFLAR